MNLIPMNEFQDLVYNIAILRNQLESFPSEPLPQNTGLALPKGLPYCGRLQSCPMGAQSVLRSAGRQVGLPNCFIWAEKHDFTRLQGRQQPQLMDIYN